MGPRKAVLRSRNVSRSSTVYRDTVSDTPYCVQLYIPVTATVYDTRQLYAHYLRAEDIRHSDEELEL